MLCAFKDMPHQVYTSQARVVKQLEVTEVKPTEPFQGNLSEAMVTRMTIWGILSLSAPCFLNCQVQN